MTPDMIKEFRKRAAALPRERLLELIKEQDVQDGTYGKKSSLIKGINRIEYVFSNKLSHIGIHERPLSNEELAMLLDPPFQVDKYLLSKGFTENQQRQAFIAKDPVLWSKKFLKINPRVYQILMMRDPGKRKVFRCGRRLGKTFTLSVLLLHYSYTTNNGRCLVMAPMKAHVGLIYEEIMKLAENGLIANSIVRNVTNPQYEIVFSNGSTVRLFTTGMKSGSKSDVARGQEAHIIILDEMDYMGTEDLDALYAMLQQTSEDTSDKMLIGASTPRGTRERFYDWCTKSKYFREFYFPSYVNPYWKKEDEEEMRDEYSPMAYRHEIEADWGEDTEGVYPRKFVDAAFNHGDWDYKVERNIGQSIHLMGVDWDKYNAGPNIVVLEAFPKEYPDKKLAGTIRCVFRREIPKSEYVLTEAVDYIISLDNIFDFAHIYLDKGYGEMQYEMIKKVIGGNKVKGINFAASVEVRDPINKQPTKKEIKPFMVDNLRTLLERQNLRFPSHDEELYMQLISYVIVRTTSTGRPVFESSGSQKDHAHDALMLASLAYTENYGDMFDISYARRGKSVSNMFFSPTIDVDSEELSGRDRKIIGDKYGSLSKAPMKRNRKGAWRSHRRSSSGSSNSRKMF